MMLYTRKQMEREVDRRIHEENLRRYTEEEINQLNKRMFMLEDRVRTLEYKVCPEHVLVNTEAKG